MSTIITTPYSGEWCVDSHDQKIADAFREELDHGWSAEHILSILCTEFLTMKTSKRSLVYLSTNDFNTK